MGDQNKHHIGRRLFQHFEQAVGRLQIHAFGRVHQHHAPAAAHGCELDIVDEGAHGVDFDLQQLAPHGFALGDFGREFVKIGMALLGKQMA